MAASSCCLYDEIRGDTYSTRFLRCSNLRSSRKAILAPELRRPSSSLLPILGTVSQHRLVFFVSRVVACMRKAITPASADQVSQALPKDTWRRPQDGKKKYRTKNMMFSWRRCPSRFDLRRDKADLNSYTHADVCLTSEINRDKTAAHGRYA